jgi:rare lipoprotein A
VKFSTAFAITFAMALVLGATSQSDAQVAQTGIASVYSTKIGTKTASGQRLNDGALTAAHRTLPFGTKVRVTNKRNGKSVIVIINDRGPFIKGRIIDLTITGANAIGMGFGLAPVIVEVL